MTGKPLSESVEEQKRDERLIQLQKKIDDLNEAQKQLKALNRELRTELTSITHLREFLFGLTKTDPTSPSWAFNKSNQKKSEHVPILFASDFQWGEVIEPGRMGGVNAYNVDIAQKRYRLLIDRTVDISFNHLPNNTYKGIYYLRGGDMVSGDIHDDLRESNELAAVPAVRSLVASERWGIGQLAEAFGKVHVISVPGNHGRTTKKFQHKRGAIDNYDTLSAWWLESMFDGDNRVTFYTPESGDAFFRIYGRRYLMTHGDRIGSRGGQGFIGPAATIMRGMKKTYDVCAGMGMTVHKMFIGHFHTAYELDYGWANGSLPGYSEFARDGRMKPEEPTQWLLFFHKKYGVTSRWQVHLGEAPVLTEESMPFEVTE